ncbi:MAG: serine hydroxymethyltransferase [Leptolyngbyaceae cyanobacterium RM2_2_4]|nr:serine hydroxymethyltransferase [Richelia sp. SM2_1_7]NJM21780.1 serine hydroxymethyltransferase [Richelia sp. SM1_7_0]NJN13647.1 serine hydroxymethyltransferase [Richelia sp. RM1_1_1]NJO52563.1 serine hydroxymethyltransferase [Leptolyngbyaceae cyanobacterium RM2_2_4]
MKQTLETGKKSSILVEFAQQGFESLSQEDPVLYDLIEKEYYRQQNSLAMVASCSTTHSSVLACEGTFTSNVTAEGYPEARFHAGCKYVDQFEQLAIDRAKKALKAKYANVQPHSASTANQIVMFSLLKPGDTLLGLDLDAGGHLSHGSKVNISGQFFNAITYGLNDEGFIDYEQVEELALNYKPKLIICGTTAYPRVIYWEKFREIADKIGAYLLADITHIAGLVIANEHPNPIDIAHITTTCTHKQLYGPRGGLILMGKDWECSGPDGQGTLAKLLQKGVFPFMQGAPIVNKIVAKARALDWSMNPEFKETSRRIILLAKALTKALMVKGVKVISGGTDNHIVVIDVLVSFGVTGIIAEKALEECNLIVNKNRIPGDQKSPFVTSGVRIGTNSLAFRKFEAEQMEECADLIIKILSAIKVYGDREYELKQSQKEDFQAKVISLSSRFPIPGYPTSNS